MTPTDVEVIARQYVTVTQRSFKMPMTNWCEFNSYLVDSLRPVNEKFDYWSFKKKKLSVIEGIVLIRLVSTVHSWVRNEWINKQR